MLRIFVKGLLFFCILGLFFLAATLVRLLILNQKNRLVYSNKLTSFFCKPVLAVLGINVVSNVDADNLGAETSYLILSNHLSYVDIFVLSSLKPAAFIASVDQVKNNKILGIASELSGSVFVERRNRSKIQDELKMISDVFDMGASVVLFPEGTTSNGEKVLNFKSSFLAVAENKDIDVLPVTIKYTKIDNEEITSENRDHVYYYGDMNFFSHFFKLLSVKSIDVKLNFLEVILSERNYSRKELAHYTYSAISSAFFE